MAERGGIVGKLQEVLEDRTGLTLADAERIELMEGVVRDHRALQKEMDLLGWTVLDYFGGNPQEVDALTRRKWAQKSRTVWLQDPQAGAATDLMNDFTFSRGVPKPRAKDEEVQKVIDEAWDDPDNQLVLTSYEAQMKLGTDLSLQANVFFLMFEGDDGKIKLGLLNHDEVENAVRDPDNRLRVLLYVARHKPPAKEWDWQQGVPVVPVSARTDIAPTYYEHWQNAEDASPGWKKPPAKLMGKGRVYHVAINATSEQVFGNPPMRRLLRWYSAYNDFMTARVDMAQAAAAFIMRRKIKGTPNQVAKMAAKAISRRSELAGATGTGDDPPQSPPHGGSILTENENVTHENLNLNSNAGAAQQDAQMLRSAISSATRFPQSYYGDASNSNLATATSLELPVLKAVEGRQEVFEGVFRWFVDRVIEKAVEAGKLDKYVEDADTPEDAVDTAYSMNGDGPPIEDTGLFGPPSMALQQSYEDQNVDEQRTKRDLSYEFSMPNPLRRMMTDLSAVIASTAQTFDPNGTNVEMSRILLTILLGEGLEVQDPSDVVDRIFPEGYADPALAGMMGGPQPPPSAQAAPGPDGQQHPEPQNPYGAPGMSNNYQRNQGQMQQAMAVSRAGIPFTFPVAVTPPSPPPQMVEAAIRAAMAMVEARYADLPDTQRAAPDGDQKVLDAEYSEDVVAVATAELTRLVTGTNGSSPTTEE